MLEKQDIFDRAAEPIFSEIRNIQRNRLSDVSDDAQEFEQEQNMSS